MLLKLGARRRRDFNRALTDLRAAALPFVRRCDGRPKLPLRRAFLPRANGGS